MPPVSLSGMALEGVDEGFSDEELLHGWLLVGTARKLLSGPARWTRGTLARDGRGREVLPDDPHAARWCANGALLKVAAEADGEPLRWRRRAVPGDLGAQDVEAGASGRLALELVGRALAFQLSPGAGRPTRRGFVPYPEHGKPPSAIPFFQLVEQLNDDPGSSFQLIDGLLAQSQAAIIDALALRAGPELPAPETPQAPDEPPEPDEPAGPPSAEGDR